MDVSKAVERLRYHVPQPEKEVLDECEKTFWLKTTLDRGITDNLNFIVPADTQAFTDTNATYITVTFRVTHTDGSVLGDEDQVFLSPGSLQAMFRSVQVFLNGAPLEPTPLEPTNAYSWSSTLTSYLGLSKSAREDVWTELAGMRLPNFNSSQLRPEDAGFFDPYIRKVAKSKEITFTGRLMSDFLQSCSQLLPPGIKLQVNMARNPDSFPLCACMEDPNIKYKVDISSASLFVRRVQLCKPVLERCLASIADGAQLAYTRMGCVINQVPAIGVSYRVGNIFNGGPLPHTLYLVLANQFAYAGSQRYLGNFFESSYLRSVQVLESGRPVLTQPLRTNFVYLSDGVSIDDSLSDGTEPFLTVTQALNGIADSHIAAGLSYREYLRGCIVTCVQLNSCGGTRVGPGFIDVEMEFESSPMREPCLLLCFAEWDRTLRLDQHLNLRPF